MKLFRFKKDGKEKPGIIINDHKYDVSSFIEDYNEHFFANDGLDTLKNIIEKYVNESLLITSEVFFASPVARPSKIVCIGLNYLDHAKEANLEIPKEPIIFFKSTTALCGPNDDVYLPRNSHKTDWEVELAIVVNKKASYVNESEAFNYIAGYTLMNDISERNFQLERNGTWDKGKGCDTFGPLGPILFTKDEIADIDNIDLWLKVNNNIMQNGSTANMIYKVPYLVSYISQFMTLLPGDIISTGTPAGVGMGMKPQVFLKKGDVMEMGSSIIGVGKQVIK